MIYSIPGASEKEETILLPMWVIYYNPEDYPGKYVVRRWVIGPGKMTADPVPFVCDSLAEARAAVPLGAFWLDRAPVDEPQIKEIWV